VRLPAKWIAGTAGAGDAVCAGAVLGLHEGWPLNRCLQAAVCAAAMSLADPTCTKGMQSLAACLAVGKKYGYRAVNTLSAC
jgi:sugar/nucleoside kinase (ribokinase family)